MDNNDVNINGTGEGQSAPKPLRKLVKVNKDTFENYPPANEVYRGRYEAEPGEYHGLHEAPQSEYHGLHEAPRSEYRGQHEAQPYSGSYADDDGGYYDYGYDYEDDRPKKRFSLKDAVIKTVAVVTSIVLIGALILNMPILLDKKTGGNVSVISPPLRPSA